MSLFRSLLVSLLISSSVFPVSVSFAQENADETQLGWPKDAWENFKSPVTTDAKYPLLIGAGVTALLLIFEDQIVDPAQEEAVEHKPLGPFSKIGDLGGRMYPNALYAVGMLGYGLIESDSSAKRNASGMFQASLYSIAVTGALKYTVREPRPDSSNRDSFPSGHTTAAFSFASYIGCRHSLGWGIAAYSLATFVGFSRVNDNRHYLHDVTAGAAIGAAYGIGVCLAENSRSSQTSSNQSVRWFASPTDGGAIAGLTIKY